MKKANIKYQKKFNFKVYEEGRKFGVNSILFSFFCFSLSFYYIYNFNDGLIPDLQWIKNPEEFSINVSGILLFLSFLFLLLPWFSKKFKYVTVIRSHFTVKNNSLFWSFPPILRHLNEAEIKEVSKEFKNINIDSSLFSLFTESYSNKKEMKEYNQFTKKLKKELVKNNNLTLNDLIPEHKFEVRKLQSYYYWGVIILTFAFIIPLIESIFEIKIF